MSDDSGSPGSPVRLQEALLCDYCGNLPEFIFKSLVSGLDDRKTDQSWTVQGFEQGAALGCRLCVLISNGFQVKAPEFPEFSYWFEALDEKYREVDPIGKLCVWCVSVEGVEVCHFRLEKSFRFSDIQMPLHQEVDSKSAVRLAKEWISACDDKHECVSHDRENGWIPTRLLDLGRKGDPLSVRLITRKDVKTTDRRYTALSHCWGPDPAAVPRTMLENLNAMRSEVKIQSLTKTFKDFIVLTHDLGIRYAWIDSLCIIQNSIEDFEIECAQMCDVYSQAYCTIAASDANDGNDGCFMPRETHLIEAVQLQFVDPDTVEQRPGPESCPVKSMVKIYPVLPPFARTITGPLAARGWTLQERELSPRIIHFTKNRILWECRRCVAAEEHPKQRDKIQVLNKESDCSRSLLRMMDGINGAKDELPKKLSRESRDGRHKAKLEDRWQYLVEEYSRRELTNRDDRLSAISGLAAKFSRLINSSAYLAGIWEEGLTRGLCWIPISATRLPTQVWPPTVVYAGIPSWSWAAFDGPIMHFSDDCRSNHPNVGTGKDAPFTHKNGLDPFGSVSGGAICLLGMATGVVASEEDYQPVVQDYQLTGSVIESYNPPRSQLLLVGTPHRRHQDPGAVGVSVFGRLKESASAPEFRSKKFRNNQVFPPKRYIIEKNLLHTSRMCLYFDVDPLELRPTNFLCLETNSGKFPWPLSGIPTRNGLVLLQTENLAYRRVGLFMVERDNPVWKDKSKTTKIRIV